MNRNLHKILFGVIKSKRMRQAAHVTQEQLWKPEAWFGIK